MNISVSNIAWKKKENEEALAVLNKQNVHAIDIAPTILFNSVHNVTKEEIHSEQCKYKKHGIDIVAMQSLLFGLPEISFFDGPEARETINNHLKKIFFIARELNVKNLVFGSPKNRFITDFNNDIENIAIKFFTQVCSLAKDYNATICLEANPKEYGCNFITNTFEAVDFIKKVNKSNFKLNFDTSTIILNNNKFQDVLDYAFPYVQHVHISSPNIQEIDKLDHKLISELLKSFNYTKYVSLEMKPNINNNNIETLKKNLSIVAKFYS
jgi:sugar phosphate isomerase/epimerase|tara:strand:- start:922 stop:1725 length:804 start_codon:yes stop_codon:yes gene_type:complete